MKLLVFLAIFPLSAGFRPLRPINGPVAGLGDGSNVNPPFSISKISSASSASTFIESGSNITDSNDLYSYFKAKSVDIRRLKARQSKTLSEGRSFNFDETIAHWWAKLTKGRSGLLLFLAPIVAGQFRILRATLPFLTDRVLQYIQPSTLIFLSVLSQQKGVRIFRTILLCSICLGLVQMVQDTLVAGSAWLPATPSEDSYALITGASSGLGKALSYQFFDHGYNLILIARNDSVLRDLKIDLFDEQRLDGEAGVDAESLSMSDEESSVSRFSRNIWSAATQNAGHTRPFALPGQEESSAFVRKKRRVELMSCDLSNPLAPFEVLRELKKRSLENKIDVLVVNAARGAYGPVQRAPWQDLRQLVDLNIATSVTLIRNLIPRMIHRRHQYRGTGGRVLLISSVAGEVAGPTTAAYSASKSFISTFASSIRRELLQHGILVTVAKPGPLQGTNFFGSMGHLPAVLKLPFAVLTSDEAARQIIQGVQMGREVVCPGWMMKLYVHVIVKILPSSFIAAAVQGAWDPTSKSNNRSQQQQSNSLNGNKSKSRYSRRRNWEQKLSEIWYRPVIDYDSIKRWFEALKVGEYGSSSSASSPNTSETDENTEQRSEDYGAEERQLRYEEESEEYSAREYYTKLYRTAQRRGMILDDSDSASEEELREEMVAQSLTPNSSDDDSGSGKVIDAESDSIETSSPQDNYSTDGNSVGSTA